MSLYDAVLFDFDGVLVDSEPIHFRCWNEILAGYGIELTWENYATNCIGIADRRMLESLCNSVRPPVDVEKLFATYPAKKARFRLLMEQEPPVCDGVVDFVRSLGDYKLAVVSSSGRSEVQPILERGGLMQYLGALVCAADVARLKPAPDPYLLAAEVLQARRPLVVEDSDAGEESGRAAGFDVLRVRSTAEVVEAVRSRLGLAR